MVNNDKNPSVTYRTKAHHKIGKLMVYLPNPK